LEPKGRDLLAASRPNRFAQPIQQGDLHADSFAMLKAVRLLEQKRPVQQASLVYYLCRFRALVLVVIDVEGGSDTIVTSVLADGPIKEVGIT